MMIELDQQVPGVYNQRTAQVMMTLCGISYWAKNSDIKAGIVGELANTSYSTAGQWSLVWGPATSAATDNLIYVVRLQQTQVYAIVMRGTVEAYGSIIEDIPTGQVDFSKYSASGAQVSLEFGNALFALTFVRDPTTNTSLFQFLNGVINSAGATIYCTGHSQGGALAPMMMARLGASAALWKAKLHTYSFAGPTSGNPAFANWADGSGALVRVVNPLDVVPYGYAAIDQLVPKNIPCAITDWLEKDIFEDWLDWVETKLKGTGAWQQPSTQTALTGKPATGWVLDQVLIQHECNSYLKLLGAPQLDFLPKSPL
jgi:Lipase (class 3)